MAGLLTNVAATGLASVALAYSVLSANAWAGSVEVTITSDQPAMAEAGTVPGTFTVTRDSITASPLFVNIELTGSATFNSDYTIPNVFGGAPLAVSIPANEGSATFTATPFVDNLAEGPEDINVTLQPGTGYSVGAASTVQLTLTDDVIEVNLSVVDDEAAEQGLDPASFMVTRSNNGDIASAIFVNIEITGSASFASDYSVPGVFGGAPQAVAIQGGDLSAAFTVTPVADNNVEGPETILVTLRPSAAVYIVGADTEATITLTDDVPEINLTVVDDEAAEQGLDPASFMVTRSNNGDIASAIIVNIELAGTAQISSDYSAPAVFGGAPQAAFIQGGQLSTTLTITPVADNNLEGTETIVVTLQPDAAVYTVGADTEATITLTDDVPEINLTVVDDEAAEQGLDPASFMVTRSNNGDIASAIIVNIELAGTAQISSDYSAPAVFGGAPQAVIIQGGQLSATLTIIPIADNPDDEGEETIEIALQPGANYLLGPMTSGTITLADLLDFLFASSFETTTAQKRCVANLVEADAGRYFDQGTTVLDLETDLTWLKCGLDELFEWATQTCFFDGRENHQMPAIAAFNDGLIGDNSGFADWRKPTARELASLSETCTDTLVRGAGTPGR